MNTYDPAKLQKKPKKGKPNKGIVIFLIATVLILGIGIAGNADPSAIEGPNVDYIGVLEVHGTMNSDGSDPLYDQQWLLANIDYMMYDDYNKGLMLSIDTPGGSVYTVDELYLKIKEYQEVTGRPVYAYMESMAASGGYYIAAPANRIFANRNCWTGSIGVTVGTVYDISEFLDGLGIKTVTITAGENKAMGSIEQPLTKEQKAIYQSLVDESYEQFISVIAEGRAMDKKKLVKLADGRIYTAKQAKANGLIDEIGTREEALADMKTQYQLEDCTEEYFIYEPSFSLGDMLFGMSEVLTRDVESEYEQILRIMEEDKTFTITYLSEIRK